MAANGWLSQKLETGKVKCLACAQGCRLDEGEYGICGVRKVENGELKLLVYGLAAAANVDPVEKKPMFHFLPASKVYSVGTVGCNFSCSFCQNYQISQYPNQHNHQIIGQKLSPEQVVALAIEGGCQSIAYTYNEPTVFFEYTFDTAKLAHEKGLKNIYVTSGFETHQAIDLLTPHIDGMNIDIKAFSEQFYREICGARLKPVLDTVKYAYEKRIWIEITTLLIPGKNDSDAEIRNIAKFIADIDPHIPWHISAFYPTYKMLDVPHTPAATLRRAYKIGQEEGLKYLYVGNVDDDDDHQSTYCPECRKRVVDRRGHVGQQVSNTLVGNGICPYCDYPLEGLWE